MVQRDGRVGHPRQAGMPEIVPAQVLVAVLAHDVIPPGAKRMKQADEASRQADEAKRQADAAQQANDLTNSAIARKIQVH